MFLLIFILIFLSMTFISTPSKISCRTNIYDFGFYNSDPKGIWVKNHRYSTNPVDRAIVMYYEARTKDIDSTNIEKSYYLPSEDKYFRIISSINMKNVPDMIARIKSGDLFSGLLMHGVEAILKVKPVLDSAIEVSPAGRNKWLDGLNKIISDAPIVVDEVSMKINDKGVINEARNELRRLGLLAIPYIYENKNSDELIKVVSTIYGDDIKKLNPKVIKNIILELKDIL